MHIQGDIMAHHAGVSRKQEQVVEQPNPTSKTPATYIFTTSSTAGGRRTERRPRPAVQPGDVVLNEGRLAAQGRAAEATADRAPRMDIVRSAVRAAVVLAGPVDHAHHRSFLEPRPHVTIP